MGFSKSTLFEIGMWLCCCCFVLKAGEVSGLTVTVQGGTGIPDLQALKLRCSYTDSSGGLTDFKWEKKNGSGSYERIVDGTFNPVAASFRNSWAYKGVFFGNYNSTLDIQLPASYVRSQFAGIYRCTVNTFAGHVTDEGTATVYYKPVVSVPSTNTVIEFTTLQITCTSVANPSVSTNNYRWTGPGGYSSTGPTLQINNIDRNKRGDYICTATNTLTPTGGSSQQGTGTGQVNVVVQYKPTVTVPSTFTVIEFSTLQITCTSAANPSVSTNNYRWTGPGGYSSTGPTLQINNIDRNKRGGYTCTATNTLTPTGGSSQQGTGTGQVNVVIQYKPTVTVPYSTFTVIELTTLQISCTSVANPPVSTNNYRWTGPGGYSSTGPTLQINNIDRNKRGDYTCTATNTLTPTGGSSQQETGTGQVNAVVQYKPTVTVPSTYTMIEFITLQITCTSNANPPVSTNNYRWTGPGGYSSTGPTLQINNIDRNKRGDYTCTAINTLTPTGGSSQQGTGTGQVNVVVQYKPAVTIPPTYIVNESTTLHITCTSDANPPVLTNNYRWTGPGGYSSTGPTLQINSIDRNKRGDYTCTATNTLTPTGGSSQQGTGTGQVNVVIQYGPGNSISFASGQSSLRLVEGRGSWNETCTADCNPVCDYSWKKGSNTVTSTPVISINNVRRENDSTYTCVVHNGIGPQKTKDFTLIVLYMDESDFTVDKANVTENETVTMRCKVESKPVVKTTLVNKDNGTTLSDEITNDKTFVIQRADCLDGATYVCNSTNQEIPRTSIKSQQIIVRCSPRVDYRREVVFEFAKNISETVEFVASVIAYPKPTFNWYHLGKNNLEKIPETTIHEQVDDGLTTTLRINVTSDKDYGKYALKVVNSEGEKQMEFSLTATSKPSPPESLKIQNKTTESVQLSWISGFNGGSAQTFHIIYTTKLIDSYENWNKWNKNINDPGRGKCVYENVTKLTSITKYKFAVFSTNSFGQSDYLISEAVTTKEIPKVSAANFPAAAVGGGIGAALVVILIVILVYIFVLKKRRLQPEPSNNMNGHKKKCSDKVAMTNVPSVTTRQDGENEYEGLDRTSGDHQAYEKIRMYENIKQKRDTDGENQYEGLNRGSDEQQTYEKIKMYENIQLKRNTETTYENTK